MCDELNTDYCVRISGKADCTYHSDFAEACNNLAQADGDGHVLFDGLAFAAKKNGRMIFDDSAPRAGRYLVTGTTQYEGSDEIIGWHECAGDAFRDGYRSHHEDWHVYDCRYGVRIAGYYSHYHGGGESYGTVCAEGDKCTC